MAVTNQLSKQRLSKRTISTGIAYTYAGVIDTIGYRGMGAYIDNKSAAFGGTCINTTDVNCNCCGDSGPPYFDCNTCNYYYVQFAANPSSSFSSSPSGGYYDASSTLIKKGFKSFAISSDNSSVFVQTSYDTCATNCATTTEQNIISGSGGFIGNSSFAGIKEADGTLWTWGYNNYGQLGNNNVLSTKSPVQLGSGSWKMISGEYYGFAAIRSDDTLWTWGYNNAGQLGDGTTINRSSPVQIAGSWKYINVGRNGTVSGIKSDDTLWTWGYNLNGNLGDNSTVSKSSPVQVSGGGSWQHVFCGQFTTYAIKTNGTMYGWGLNGSDYGIGDGTTTNRSSPVQIGTLYSDWIHVKVKGSGRGGVAIRSNGTAYTWGYIPYGLSIATYSLPTQIGSATNHKQWSIGSPNGIGGIYILEYCEPFITTDGNVLAYNAYNSTQVSKYNGGGATQLIVDAQNFGYSSDNNAFLMKYIE